MHFRFPLCRFIVVAALVAGSLGGCTNKKKGDGDYGGQYGGADGDYVSGTPLPDREEGVSFLGSNVDRNRFQAVYFAFDSYDVGSGEMSKVDEVASYLRSSGGRVIVAEYNRGLGERRALAVRSALISAGVDPSVVQTVSFGAEMPADPGSGEAAWARNRRAEFGVVR
jgi:peptidoglycan-associated lipoprotein